MNRVDPYQMKKIPSRSPGTSHFAWRASQSRVIAPRSPDSDSYRNSGWKNVVSTGNAAQG